MLKVLKLLSEKQDHRIYEFSPTLLRPFYVNYEPLPIKRRIRFLLELLKGYMVYYLEVSGDITAYSVISKGGGRYSFATDRDIVVGPYFVREEYRGRRYSELLISELLNCGSFTYDSAYAWIRKDNIPSLRCALKVGFEIIGTLNISRYLRRIYRSENDDGEFLLLKKPGPGNGAATQ